jgi:chlorobactene glucosyltransferase
MLELALLITCALLGMTGITLINLLTFPRLRPASSPAARRRISVLVPARNEAEVIAETVRSLLAQELPDLEILILDDNSTDGTAAIAWAAGAHDPRLRVLAGSPLPTGWSGKPWACHQLAQAANGEWLIFTDADVRWQPGALAALAAEMERTHADLLTVWPTQVTETWAERMIVPLMALAVIGYLPAVLVHHVPWRAFTAATGQCLAFRRVAYDAIGGHAAVAATVLDDMRLARAIKKRGLRLRMADSAGLLVCRMYRDWPTVRDGFAKNILAGYGDRVLFLALATLFHWLVFLGPWIWLALGRRGDLPGWPLWPLALGGLGLGVRAVTAAFTRQRARDAWTLPLAVLLMTWIAIRSVWWHWRYGGPQWKGRVITPAPRHGR